MNFRCFFLLFSSSFLFQWKFGVFFRAEMISSQGRWGLGLEFVFFWELSD